MKADPSGRGGGGSKRNGLGGGKIGGAGEEIKPGRAKKLCIAARNGR